MYKNKFFKPPFLDFGCNEGHVTSRIFSDFDPNDVWVADISNKLNPLNRSKFKNFLTISESDSTIDCASDFFNYVNCKHVIEHIQNPILTIKEFSRIIRRGGYLYIETPNPRSIFVPSLSKNATWNFYDDHTHIRPYSSTALKRLCEHHDFEVIKCGIFRNWKYALSLPLAPFISLLLWDSRPLHYSTIHAIGWSSFCLCVKK